MAHPIAPATRLAAAFDQFCRLYPPPVGQTWSLRATRLPGIGRKLYFLGLVDNTGAVRPVPESGEVYYLSEFVAFLEALVAAASEPLLKRSGRITL